MTPGTPDIVSPGVVLGQVVTRDTDRVVTLFTAAHGKVTAYARGAANSRRRFGAGLSAFVVSDVRFDGRRTGDMWTLADLNPVRDHAMLAVDPVALGQGSYAIELVRELFPLLVPEPVVVDLLEDVWRVLSGQPSAPAVLRAFELRVLDLLGFRPVFDACVATGVALGHGAVLDPGRGGALAASAPREGMGRGVVALCQASIDRLNALQDLAWPSHARELPELEPVVTKRVRDATTALLGVHLRGPLRSLAYLRQLRA